MRQKHSKLKAIQPVWPCEHVAAGTPAHTAAGPVGVDKNTSALFYCRLRGIIAVRRLPATPVRTLNRRNRLSTS